MVRMEETEKTAPTGPLTEEPQVSGVLVAKVKNEGIVGTEVHIIGEIEPTEVQTLLELGVLQWRQKIGLSK